MDLRQAILSGIADHREPKPRSAMCIALVVYGPEASHHLGTVLFRLEELKAEGQVRSVTDEAGVMRWVMVDEEAQTSDAMELGAQVLLNHHVFDITPSQAWHMGFEGP